MAHYRTGTLSLVNGSNVVTGTGTDFISGAAIGECVQAPDGKLYEIASIQSATALTLGSVYLGSTSSGQGYSIVPTQSYIRDLAVQAATLVNGFQSVKDTAGVGKFPDGTQAAPGLRFASDEDTGVRRVGVNSVALVAGGVDRATASAAGVLIPVVDINGGTIDGAVVGGAVPAAGSFTTLSASGGVDIKNGGVSVSNLGEGYLARGQVASYTDDAANGGLVFEALVSGVLAERARITSTGLSVTGGISATGPTTIATFSPSIATNPVVVRFNNGGTGDFFLGKDGSVGDAFGAGSVPYTAHIYNGANTPMEFWTNAVRRMIIDASGNLGLGVVPSAWSGYKAYMVGRASFASVDTSTFVAHNSYWSGVSETYVATDYATRYQQASGIHAWLTAPSGTAGNPISFTQAMTLDASSNLDILGNLTSRGNTHTIGSTTPNQTTSVDFRAFRDTGTATHIGSYVRSVATLYGGLCDATQLEFGTSNPAVSAWDPTTKMTLDAGGNLLGGGLTAYSAPSGNGWFLNSGASAIGLGHVAGTASSTGYAIFYYAGAQIGSITQSGATAVLYNTTSDARLKENITDASDAASLIDALQVRQFDWKSDGSHQRYGFVAQELFEVAPEAVSKPQDPDEMMAVDYSKLVPMLVKEIQALRARVAQLEGI